MKLFKKFKKQSFNNVMYKFIKKKSFGSLIVSKYKQKIVLF